MPCGDAAASRKRSRPHPKAPPNESSGVVRPKRACPPGQWARLTAAPLRELPWLQHEGGASRSGKALPPPPRLQRCARWAAAQLAKLGAVPCHREPSPAWRFVRTWRYEQLGASSEALLTVSGEGGRCACKARKHMQHNIKVVIDVRSGEAWQGCYDRACVRSVGRGGYVAAYHPLGRAPVEVLPSLVSGVDSQTGFDALTLGV